MMTRKIKVGLLCSVVRPEEKALIGEAARRKDVEVVKLDPRRLVLDADPEAVRQRYPVDIVLDREVGHTRALYALALFEAAGVPCVNRYEVARVCHDKLLTSKRLKAAGVPTPEVRVAFGREGALQAIEELGYPVVLKPLDGSWGRLLAKLNDRDAAEAVLEHKEQLGGPQHKVFYIQKFVEKPGRDIRAFAVGDEVVCAIYREAEHWITNTARGARARECPVTPELAEVCLKAYRAVGGGVLAIDLMETPHGLVVHEINATMEFRNTMGATGVNVPARIWDYVVRVARHGRSPLTASPSLSGSDTAMNGQSRAATALTAR